MSDLAGYSRRYRSSSSTLSGLPVLSIGAANALDSLLLGPTPLDARGFTPGLAVLSSPTMDDYEVTALEIKSRDDSGNFIYSVSLAEDYAGSVGDFVSFTQTDTYAVLPTGDKPKNKEGFEMCVTCGDFYAISELAKIKGRWYCIPNGHAEEAQ